MTAVSACQDQDQRGNCRLAFLLSPALGHRGISADGTGTFFLCVSYLRSREVRRGDLWMADKLPSENM